MILMKKHLRVTLVLGALLLLQISLKAQPFAINWFTIDGGGGSSSGGGYTITGTIGQADANQTLLTGGSYSLWGGFWTAFAVQTTGAPVLTITPAGIGFVTIAWTPPTPGWILQESTTLSPPVWVNSPSGSTNPVLVPSTLPGKFYRLFKP